MDDTLPSGPCEECYIPWRGGRRGPRLSADRVGEVPGSDRDGRSRHCFTFGIPACAGFGGAPRCCELQVVELRPRRREVADTGECSNGRRIFVRSGGQFLRERFLRVASG